MGRPDGATDGLCVSVLWVMLRWTDFLIALGEGHRGGVVRNPMTSAPLLDRGASGCSRSSCDSALVLSSRTPDSLASPLAQPRAGQLGRLQLTGKTNAGLRSRQIRVAVRIITCR